MTSVQPVDDASIKSQKKNLRAFLRFVISHLDSKEAQRLLRVISKAFEGTENSSEALMEVIFGDRGQKRGQWVFIQVDWKAYDEIAWQVKEILSLLGIEDEWKYEPETGLGTVTDAFVSLSGWLEIRGFSLAHLETSGDWYCSLIVKDSDLDRVKDLASAAELKIYDQNQFLEANSSDNYSHSSDINPFLNPGKKEESKVLNLGILTPILLLSILVIMNLVTDSIWGSGYYSKNAWPKVVGLIVDASTIGLLGYRLNRNITAAQYKHRFLWIPMEYWGPLIIVIAVILYFVPA